MSIKKYFNQNSFFPSYFKLASIFIVKTVRRINFCSALDSTDGKDPDLIYFSSLLSVSETQIQTMLREC